MTLTQIAHSRFVRMIESVLGHVAALVIGFVLMVIGLGLGVTLIMLPAGIVVGLIGAAIFVGGFFAHPLRNSPRG